MKKKYLQHFYQQVITFCHGKQNFNLKHMYKVKSWSINLKTLKPWFYFGSLIIYSSLFVSAETQIKFNKEGGILT
jgi:hypothetical protein